MSVYALELCIHIISIQPNNMCVYALVLCIHMKSIQTYKYVCIRARALYTYYKYTNIYYVCIRARALYAYYKYTTKQYVCALYIYAKHERTRSLARAHARVCARRVRARKTETDLEGNGPFRRGNNASAMKFALESPNIKRQNRKDE